MQPRIETLDKLKAHVFKTLSAHYQSLDNCKYADLRFGISEFKSASSENGQSKDVTDDYDASFSVRVIAGEMSSWGFYGQSLGRNDLKIKKITSLIITAINTAYERAIANAKKKSEFKKKADSLTEVRLAKIKVCQDTVPADFEIDPQKIPLHKVLKTSMDVSRQMKELDPSVLYTATG
jgi:TldD protein